MLMLLIRVVVALLLLMGLLLMLAMLAISVVMRLMALVAFALSVNADAAHDSYHSTVYDDDDAADAGADEC